MKGESFHVFVMDQLAGLRGVEARAMFGGYGLMSGGVLIGMTWHGAMYLRVDAASLGDFVALGAGPFSPAKGRVMKAYYEVPVSVIEDADRLVEWARRAAGAARAAKAAKTAPKRRR